MNRFPLQTDHGTVDCIGRPAMSLYDAGEVDDPTNPQWTPQVTSAPSNDVEKAGSDFSCHAPNLARSRHPALVIDSDESAS